jgi:hypothetical protein
MASISTGGLSSSTFTDIGGAVSDLFAGLGAQTQASLKAQGLDIQAEGTELQAEGNLTEAQNYTLASTLASQNAQYTQMSTAIQQAQQQRSTTIQIGGQRAAAAGAGFAASGSSLDIMADSARQGALYQAVLGQQGLITEAGYQEQAQSYTNMAAAATNAAAVEENIATQTEQLASETQSTGTLSEIGDFAGALLKGAGAVASLALAPVTGGASLAVGAAAAAATSGTGGLF